MEKLNAFLGVYSEGLAPEVRTALEDIWRAWNQAPWDVSTRTVKDRL